MCYCLCIVTKDSTMKRRIKIYIVLIFTFQSEFPIILLISLFCIFAILFLLFNSLKSSKECSISLDSTLCTSIHPEVVYPDKHSIHPSSWMFIINCNYISSVVCLSLYFKEIIIFIYRFFMLFLHPVFIRILVFLQYKKNYWI